MLDEAGLPGKPVALSCVFQLQEAGMDEDAVDKPRTHVVGMDIETMSVAELTERIGLLEAEIVRLRAAITARGATRQAAESVFKL